MNGLFATYGNVIFVHKIYNNRFLFTYSFYFNFM